MDTTTETGRSKRNLQRMGSSVVSLDPVTVRLVGQGGGGCLRRWLPTGWCAPGWRTEWVVAQTGWCADEGVV